MGIRVIFIDMPLESFKSKTEHGPERSEVLTNARRTELGFVERFRKTGHAVGFTLASMLAALPATSNAEEVDVNKIPLQSYEMSIGIGELSYFEQRDSGATLKRAKELAENIGIEIEDELDIYAEGFVPTTINGVAIYDSLTQEEQEAVDGARRLSSLMDESQGNKKNIETDDTQDQEPSAVFESKPISPNAF